MAKRPAASIIILCHNDGEFLRECLDSVSRHTDVPHEVIIVNNASTDGSDRFLKTIARRPNTTVIHNQENRFFAGGNNQGIALAKGEYVMLLNADAVVGPQWLSRMIRCAERDAKTGLVVPCTNSAVGAQLVTDPGYSSMKEFPRFAQDWAEHYGGWWKEAHRVIAFCLLIKREVLERVGLLDERFGPGGYEDYDYCLRVQQAGYKAVLAQDVFVHHYGGKGYAGMDYGHHRRINREILARKWSQFIFHALDEIDTLSASESGTGRPSNGNLQDRPARRVAAGRR